MIKKYGRMIAATILGIAYIAVLIFLPFLMSGCAQQPDVIYNPTQVDMPVAVPCKAPPVAKPADLLISLPPTASLTDGIKACLAQHSYDIGYQGQLEAALSACNE